MAACSGTNEEMAPNEETSKQATTEESNMDEEISDEVSENGEEVYEPVEQFITHQMGDIRVHSYVSNDPMNDVSHIIETERSLILIDLQAFHGKQDIFNRYIEALGKPVTHTLIGFHAFGSGKINDTELIISEELGIYLAESGQEMQTKFAEMFGDELDTSLSNDFKFTTEKRMEIDGVNFEFNYVPAAGRVTAGTEMIINDVIKYAHDVNSADGNYNLYLGTHEAPVNTLEESVTETITINEIDDLRIHTYVSSDPMNDASHLIETQDSIIAIDLQAFYPKQVFFNNYINSIGKKFDTVVIGFHAFGSGDIEDKTILIDKALNAYLEENGTEMQAKFAEMFGESLNTSFADKFIVVSENPVEIDGVKFEFMSVPAEGMVTDGMNMVINDVIYYSHDIPEEDENYALYLGTHQSSVAK